MAFNQGGGNVLLKARISGAIVLRKYALNRSILPGSFSWWYAGSPQITTPCALAEKGAVIDAFMSGGYNSVDGNFRPLTTIVLYCMRIAIAKKRSRVR